MAAASQLKFLTDIWNYVSSTTGASLTACDVLVAGEFNVAINWTGGWHHAKPNVFLVYILIKWLVSFIS